MQDFLPVTKKEMKQRGWEQVDFAYITGDAYVDHPSFGTAIISRLLESRGYKVGIIPQPDWRKKESIQVFGEPRLGFLVSAGNMDSMVNHYTVSKKHRQKDSYSPGGQMGLRPDRAVIVYSNLIRQTYKKTPIILGGIEASLRRLAHYDYWENKVKHSVLLDSGADMISYGMGEHSIIEIADALASGLPVEELTYIAGTVFKCRDLSRVYDPIILPSYEEVKVNKKVYADSFAIQYQNTDPFSARPMAESYGTKGYIIQNPPAPPLTQEEMDQIGKTDVASITLVADGKELSTITNLSIGKEKDKAPAGVLENFDYYVGSNGLLDAAYGGNSAAGCSSSFTLDQEHKADGTYGAAFHYKLKTTGSEVWTGLVNASLGNTDFSAYNALKFWTKLDGKGQKVVVQIKAGGEEYEVYLTNLAKTEDAYEVTVPFSAFKGKMGGKLSGDALKDVQAFGLWCNSNPAGSAVDVESVLYFDAFKGTTISDAEAAKADADGLIAVKQTSQSGNNGGNSSSGSSTSGGNSGSTTTPDTGNTTPDTKPSETRKTDKTFENIAKDTNAILTVEKNDKGEVTDARAQLDKTVKNASETKKTTISADVVAKLVKEAGTSDITITQTTKNASGKVMNSVSVNAKDLQAGKKLTLVKVDKKTGEKVLISSRTYKVSKDGTVTADTKDAGDYVLLNEKDAKALSSKILKSVALKDTKKTVANGKKAKVTFDKNLNMENVKKITYTSSKKSVVTVNKNGAIVAKKAGKAVVKVKVTLKNGKTKTVKMTIKVTK